MGCRVPAKVTDRPSSILEQRQRGAHREALGEGLHCSVLQYVITAFGGFPRDITECPYGLFIKKKNYSIVITQVKHAPVL